MRRKPPVFKKILAQSPFYNLFKRRKVSQGYPQVKEGIKAREFDQT